MESQNDGLGALKGKQSGLCKAVETHFQPEPSAFQFNKGHGRIENRMVSLTPPLDGMLAFPGLQTLIRVVLARQVHRANSIRSFY